MSKITKFLSLPYKRKKLLVQSFFLLTVVRGSLWLFPFRWVDKWAAAFRLPAEQSTEPDPSVVSETAESIRICSSYVPYASCLTQALATKVLLALHGHGCEIKIGVDNDVEKGFMAHAWVEVNGRVIVGKEVGQSRFSVLKRSGNAIS